MGTKNNPGPYDCYARAEPDEPLFTLLGRDPSAAHLVAAWTAIRAGDTAGAVQSVLAAERQFRTSGKAALPYTDEKSKEAQQVAEAMLVYYGTRNDPDARAAVGISDVPPG